MSRGIRLPEDAPVPLELLSPELGALMTPSDAIPRSITTQDLNRALDDIEEL
jgi:hypothetical protein